MSELIYSEKFYVGLAVGVATLLIYFLWSACGGKGKTGNSGRTVLLVGPNGAGKTAMFHKLCFGTTVESQMSMKPDVASVRLGKGDGKDSGKAPLDFVDVPGHPRLRGQIVKKYANSVAGMVFVIDSSDPKIRESAEFLYDILTNPVFDERAPPILIASNKNDLTNGKRGLDDLRSLLEAELSRLKETRSSLAETGSGSKNDADEPISLGMANEKFSFERHSPCAVSFCFSSVVKDELSSIRDFSIASIE